VSGFVPSRPSTQGSRDEPTTLFDPRLHEAWQEQRWELRAAQWRALALAERVFGAGVRASLSGSALEGAFRALLHLDVPFDCIDRHRDLEARFTAAAGMDPVLVRVPFIYVFSGVEPDRGGRGALTPEL
jgi:hypothetical protein